MAILRINAGPGCGKSTTLAKIYMYIRASNKSAVHPGATDEQLAIYEWCDKNLPAACREKAGYFAYNDDIVQDMKSKVHPNTECKTAHGWGYKILNAEFGYLPINRNRSFNLVTQLTGKYINDMDSKEKFKWMSVTRHFEKLKDELLDLTMDNFQYVHNKYTDLAPFALFSDIVDYAHKLMPLMKKPDNKVGIEYIDQVWLALFVLKRPILPLGLVDEDQDLSPARLQLARRLFENIIFCGDENQAINAFSGADADSVNKIRAYVDLELPLKESFRNPPYICNYVNALTPSMQLRPFVKDKPGIEARVNLPDLASHLRLLNTSGQPDDQRSRNAEFFDRYSIKHGLNEWETTLILCRYNAPLIKVCSELIRNNIPCYILGNTLIEDLCNIVKNRNATTLEELNDKLDTWLSICTRNAPEMIAMQLADKVDCIRLIMPQCTYPEDIEKELRKFLKPKNAKGLIRLSTIHRAKGLEAKHVFILFPPIEYPKCKTDTERRQELNLHVVGVSRTSCNLIWVMNDE